MQVIRIGAYPSQTFNVTLAQQECTITLAQKATGLFLDLFVNENPVALGILCRDRVMIVRFGHLGFSGDLVFFDTAGNDDPVHSGLGDRWQLAYLEASEL